MAQKNSEKKVIIIDRESADLELSNTITITRANYERELHVFLIGTDDRQIRFSVSGEVDAPKSSCVMYVTSIAYDVSSIYVRGLCRATRRARDARLYFRHDGLLLSPTAHTQSIPSLEIETNDVRAGHATTIGSLDESSLFYLQTRGLSRIQAQSALIEGFFQRAMARVENEIDDAVRRRLACVFQMV